MSERFVVAEEQYMTNPPKHAGWAILDMQTRRPIAVSSSREKLDEASKLLNELDD
jgi:hypothetical protein